MKQLNLPSDSDLSSFANQFALACKEKNCFGICAVTSPTSELSHSGFCCDILNANFLMKNLLKSLAADFGVSPVAFVAFQAVYLSALENKAIDENNFLLDENRLQDALLNLKAELDKVFTNVFR